MPIDKGNLKKNEREKIAKNLKLLLDELDGKYLVDDMVQGLVFDHDDREEILRLQTKKERIELFLEKLRNSGPYRAYDVFLNALRNNYRHVAEKLEENDGKEAAVKTHGASYSTSSSPSYDVELLLLGKTGVGTSSTGNTILGKQHFQTCDSAYSCTADTQSGCVNRQGLTVKVVDGAAILDTRLAGTKQIEQIQENLNKAFLHCPNGFHALVLVLRSQDRFTSDQRLVVKILKVMLGSDFIQNHGILVFTNGERFLERYRNEDFKDWCMAQTCMLRNLIDECCGRVVLFHNLTPKKAKESTDQLIALARGLRRRYTVEMFELIASDRAKFIEIQGAIQFKDQINRKIDLIIQLLTEKKTDHQSLQRTVQELKVEIDKEKQSLKVVQDLKRGIQQINITRYTEALQTFKGIYNDG